MNNIDLQFGNAYELIKKIPDNSIDLVLTDPPYEFQKGGCCKNTDFKRANKLRKELKDLSSSFDFGIIKEYIRVLKTINMYIWCSWEQLYNLLDFFHHYSNENNIHLNMQMITWHKTNPIPLTGNTYLSDTEYCLFIREKGVKVYGTPATKHKYYITGINQKDKDLYKHPTIKPLEIIQNLVINSSNENDVVLDSFMGSGTTGCACKLLNRKFIGFEYNEEYFDVAKERIENTNDIVVKPKLNDNQMNIFDYM